MMNMLLRRQMMTHVKICRSQVLKVMLFLISFFVISVPTVADALDLYGQRKKFKLTASAIHQFDTNLDNGGDFSVNRYLFRFNWNKRMNDALHVGIGLNYDLHDYSFSEKTSFGQLRPWDNLQSIGLRARIMYSINEDWRLVIIPSIGFSGESGADWGESLIYGGILSAGYRASPNLMIGAGVGIFSRLEEVSYFPMVVINWKITEQLRLSNPFSGGPTGPAGLELSYALDKRWEIACGSAYRSLRFRLDDESNDRNGIFQEKGVPVWGRVTLRSGSQVKLDLNAGAFFSGKLKIEDQQGHEISDDQYDAAPFIALTVSLNF
jgi:hypothetical protein